MQERLQEPGGPHLHLSLPLLQMRGNFQERRPQEALPGLASLLLTL